MGTRQSLVIGGSLFLSCLALGLTFGLPAAAQPRPEPAAQVGRYQLVYGKPEASHYLVIDTATGRCWSSDGNARQPQWTDLGSPSATRVK